TCRVTRPTAWWASRRSCGSCSPTCQLLPGPLDPAPATGTVVRDDLAEHRQECRAVYGLALVDRDLTAGLVVVAGRDDPVRVVNERVVQEDVHVVLRGEERRHVALEDEVRLDDALDRLLDLGI